MNAQATNRTAQILLTSLFMICLLCALARPAKGATKRLAASQSRVVDVAPVEGDDYASGTVLLNAQAQAQASPYHWLLRLSPGIYDLGDRALQMTDNVSIEGSGIEATWIIGSGLDTTDLSRGIIQGANGSRLAELTVQCVNDGSLGQVACIGMANLDASPRLYRVRFLAEGAGNHWGIRNVNSSPLVEEVEIQASGGDNNYGIVNSLDSVTEIQRSLITTQSGSQQNIGIYDRDGGHAARVDDTEVYAMGGLTAVGLYNDGTIGGSVLLDDVNIQADQATNNSAVYGGGYALEVQGSILFAGGADGSAIEMEVGSQLVVTDSELLAEGICVLANDVKIGSTRLGNGTIFGEVAACSGVYRLANEGEFFADQCPTGGGSAFGNGKRTLRVYEVSG